MWVKCNKDQTHVVYKSFYYISEAKSGKHFALILYSTNLFSAFASLPHESWFDKSTNLTLHM